MGGPDSREAKSLGGSAKVRPSRVWGASWVAAELRSGLRSELNLSGVGAQLRSELH